jgi:multiple sugar transport system ATP-binding protein
VAKLGGDDVIAVFRERHQFKPGEKIRLKPEPRLVHLFDEATGQRLIPQNSKRRNDA